MSWVRLGGRLQVCGARELTLSTKIHELARDVDGYTQTRIWHKHGISRKLPLCAKYVSPDYFVIPRETERWLFVEAGKHLGLGGKSSES